MDRYGRIRNGLEAESFVRLGAVPRREVAVVRRARLHLDRCGELGLAALSLRPLDAAAVAGLDLDSGLAPRLSTRRISARRRRIRWPWRSFWISSPRRA